jgi:ATPase subunit of ABC transporter with duplicated ATPase domains
VELPPERKKVKFSFPQPVRTGDLVIELAGVRKAYGDNVVYDGLDLSLYRGDKIALVGPNGAGKSTLLKMVSGQSRPDSGLVTVGASVKLGYFAQHAMEVLVAEKTVWQTFIDAFPRTSEGALRSLAGCFGFQKDEVDKVVKVLSGGEKARLVMALMLFDPPNLLVLDEPTNHLDLATKEMLIEALRSYEGSMLFVSHDRHFLHELSNRVLELTPEGPHVYGGGYTEYVARTGREAPGLH